MEYISSFQSATLNKHIRSHQKGLRELAADKTQKQKASKSTNEGNIEKVRMIHYGTCF